jgi:hypothetical protein
VRLLSTRIRWLALGDTTRSTRHDPVAPARTWGQASVLAHLVCARWWDQRDQPFDKLASLHESLARKRRPRYVAAKPLETSSVTSGDGDARVRLRS